MAMTLRAIFAGLERAMAVLDSWIVGLAKLFVVALLATVLAGVFWRAFGYPLSWTDEASGYLMVWTACLGWMMATRRHAHIHIRFFQDHMPKSMREPCLLLIELMVFVFGSFVAAKSVHLIMVNSDIEATSMPISAAWLYVPLLPAGAVTAGQALVDFCRHWNGEAGAES
jgi:TRAP-type C4-dicarboxylate transport system permease small subunit